MEVVIDTNAIVSDYWLRSKRWQLLLGRAENDLINLHVPEAVITEAVKHFRLDLEEAERSLALAKRQAGRVLPSHEITETIDVDDVVDAYERHLRDALAGVGASFDYPAVETAELAQMAVSRQKPFKPDGSGYVDALVWMRVRELASLDEVALISNNHKDFGGTKRGGLDRALEAQLDKLGVAGSVTRYPSPSDFHSASLDHAELYDAEIRDQLRDAAVAEQIRREILALLEDREATAVGSWGSVATAEETSLLSGEVISLDLIEVTDADPEFGYAAFEATAQATYTFPVLYFEAWEAYEHHEIDDLEVDDPEQIVGSASRTVRLELIIDARYDPGTKQLGDFELTSASAVNPASYMNTAIVDGE
jgi:hypothetical protein